MNTKEKIRLLEEQIANHEARFKQTGLGMVNSLSSESILSSIPSVGGLKSLINSKFLKDDKVKLVLKIVLGIVITGIVIRKNKTLAKSIKSMSKILLANLNPNHVYSLVSTFTEISTSIFSKMKKRKTISDENLEQNTGEGISTAVK